MVMYDVVSVLKFYEGRKLSQASHMIQYSKSKELLL